MSGVHELELSTFLPADRRHAIASGTGVPEDGEGTVLFADVAGFTPLSEALADSLGPQRGAEEVTHLIERIFGALAQAVHHHHGSIITSAGDSLTCWFDTVHRLSAVASALDMQAAMAHAHDVDLTSVHSAPLALKVAVVSGSARRFLVGDPSVQLFDVLSGPAVDGAGRAEKLCAPGEVVIDRATADALSGSVILADERGDVVRVTGLEDTVPGDPWPDLPSPGIDAATLRHFITPAVFDGILGGNARFLAEFRAAGALFVSFDTDPRDDADTGIDATVRVAQEIVSRAGGSVFEVSTGDKGSYLFAAFGAPVAYGDDVRRAVTAAHELQQVCGDRVRIGLH